jgi:hypothetical protein
MSAQQLALDGHDSRVRVYINKSCLCDWSLGDRCWAARCVACGEALTKHAFSEDDAHAEAVAALDKPGHFQHKCKAAA